MVLYELNSSSRACTRFPIFEDETKKILDGMSLATSIVFDIRAMFHLIPVGNWIVI
jgi:hypothetical protein